MSSVAAATLHTPVRTVACNSRACGHTAYPRSHCRLQFSCVKSPWFDATWIGRSIDDETVAAMEAMSAAPPPTDSNAKPLDLGGSRACSRAVAALSIAGRTRAEPPTRAMPMCTGERGEYHTMCFNGPLFARPVEIELDEPLELVGQPGQKDGERWWTIGVHSPAS